MSKRNNWEEFKKLLEQNNITKLYHFTDRDNLENIIKNAVSTHGKTARIVASTSPSQVVAVQARCHGRSTSRQAWSITFVSASLPTTL